MVLEIVCITKLKIILQSKYFYIVILLLTILFVFLNVNFSNNKSVYDKKDNEFILYIDDYKLNDDYIKLTLCDGECLIGNYYFKSLDEIFEIKYGSKVIVSGNLEEPSNNTIPNNFNYKKYLNNKGIYYLLNIDNIVVDNSDINLFDKIRNFIVKRIVSFDKSGYIMAFIMGDKDYIDEEEYEKYQLIGVTHLFALSGMHVSVFVLILNKLLKGFNEKVRTIIINIVLFLYGYLLFFPASLMRTIFFYFISSLFRLFDVKISSIRVLLITFCVLVLFNYQFIYDVGFIYSFVTVGGILVSSDFIKSNNKFVASIKLSVVSFLFSLPITLYSFYSFNVLSILYNLFYIFFVSSIIYPLSIVVFIFPKLYFIYDFIIDFLVWLTEFLSKINFGIFYMDFNLFEVVLYFIFLIMFIKLNRKIYLYLIGILFFVDVTLPYFDNSAYIYCFDVGQGDSTLIISPYRKDVVMIDVGGVRSRNVSSGIVNFLKSQGINSIDLFIASHGDFDHVGDFKYFTKYIDVEKVKVNKGEFNDLEVEMFMESQLVDDYEFEGMDVYFLDDGTIYDNENDNSIISLFRIYDFKYLNSGDASIKQELNLIDKYGFGQVDLFKAGHHGSKTSNGLKFIEVIKPKYAVISVGKNNRYGHPNKEVLDNLERSKIYRTDRDGTIMFKVKRNNIEIKNYTPS